jgi:hypothetical protein
MAVDREHDNGPLEEFDFEDKGYEFAACSTTRGQLY